MVTADFLTKRHFVTRDFHSMSGEPEEAHVGEKGKVLVASSATVQPTDMSNGKNRKRRSNVPSFVNPLTGRPTTLALAVVLFAVVFIVYLMSRSSGGGSAANIDERAKNPKFHHILVPADDPRGFNPDPAMEEDVNVNRMHQPNVFQAAGAGQPAQPQHQPAQPQHQPAQVQHQPVQVQTAQIVKFPPPGFRNQHLDPKKAQAPLDLPPKPKEFPVNMFHRPDSQCPQKPYVLFLVVCMPSEVLARTAVRRTWGSPTGIAEAKDLSMSWRTVFVMGRSEAKDAQVEREAKKYGDILQGDFEDLSSEVTRKVMMGFQWAASDISASCRPGYIFKTSINVYINLPLIVPWITNKLNMASDLYVGKTLREDRPIRDKQDPLYVPYEDYPRNVFPNLARGPLYMLSMDVVHRMVPKFHHVTPIAMEDAYVGLLAYNIGVPITDDDHFVLIKKPKNFCHYRNMLFVFDIEPTEVMHVYSVVEEKHRYSECTDRGF